MRCTGIGTLLVVGIVAARPFAQSQVPPKPTFEVASVKSVPQSDETRDEILFGRRRVSMLVTDTRVTISTMSLAEIVRRAFQVERYQLSIPDWADELRFDIQATIPAGMPRDEVPTMLQSLLAQRFGMAVHRESQDVSAYALVVGKTGHKLQEAAPQPQRTADEPPRPEDFQTIRTETSAMTFKAGPNESVQVDVSRMPMAELARSLTNFEGSPVFDRTGLVGDYQFTLEFPLSEASQLLGRASGRSALAGDGGPATSASTPSGQGAFRRSVEKLGLVLESRRVPVDVIVVDRLERSPTPN